MLKADWGSDIAVPTDDVSCVVCGSSRTNGAVCTTRDFCYETCTNEFTYVECADCGNIYLKNRPTIDSLSTIYPKNYLTYDYESSLGPLIFRVRNAVQAKKIEPIRRHARANDKVVDIGCGAGDYLDIIRRHGDPSWHLLGLDFSSEAIERCKARGLDAIEGRVETLESGALSDVGVFVMNQLIEHVEDPGKVLTKCGEMLRPGGVIIMETPNHQAWDAQLFRDRYWGCWHAPRHWNVFSPQSLSDLVKRSGLEVASVEYTLCPFSWVHSVQYWMRERLGWERLGRMLELDNVFALVCGSGMDVIQKVLVGKTSNQRLIARKPML